MIVRLLTPDEKAGCEAIVRALPDWFGLEDSIVEYVADIAAMDSFGALRDGARRGTAGLRHGAPTLRERR